MDTIQIQSLLTAKFAGDNFKLARVAHFMGMLKTGIDGMSALGIVMRIEAEGLEGLVPAPAPPNALESLDSAIAHMLRATHATHEEGS
jgi:hypothetical protein